MADKKDQEKVNSLMVYAERIRTALKGNVPEKHKDAEGPWRQFMEIDLRKTEAKIQKLRGL